MAKQAFDFNSKFADLEKIKKEDEAKEQGTKAAIASTIGKVSGNPLEDDEPQPKKEEKTKEVKKTPEKKKQEPVRRQEEQAEEKPLLRVDQLFSKNPVKAVKIASFSLDEDVLQAIEKVAKKNNISKSKVVNEILKNVLK